MVEWPETCRTCWNVKNAYWFSTIWFDLEFDILKDFGWMQKPNNPPTPWLVQGTSGVWSHLPPPCFPPPRGTKILQFVLPRWTSPSLFWASNRYPQSKPFQRRFGLHFEPILAPKMLHKSTQSRIKVNVGIRLRFLEAFSFKILRYIKLPIQQNH